MTENRLTSYMQKRRSAILLTLALLIFAAFAFCYFLIVYRYPGEVSGPRFAFCFIAVAAVSGGLIWLCYYLLKHKNIKTETLFLIFMLTAGAIYSAVFLPFTIPDEHAHYLSAYRISNYMVFNFDQIGDDRLFLRTADANLLSVIRSNRISPDYYDSIVRNFDFFIDGSGMTTMPSVFVGNAPLGYIASGFGIALGRILHLGAMPTFYLGRLANLALYAVAVWWAMKRMPYGKTALFVISALPMTIHITASYSYDFLVIALAILFVSQVLYMREKTEKITVKDIILCAVWAMLLAPSKLIYFPILLTVFLIPSEKFGLTKKKAMLIKCGIIAAGIAALLITQIGRISTYVSDGNTVKWTGTEAYSISHVLSHPFEFLRVLANTFLKKTDYFISTMVGSYMGSLQIIVPVFMWAPMFVMLFFSFLRRKDEEGGVLPFSGRIAMWLLALVTCTLAALSMLFSWTPLTSTTIEGIQGRYFIPALPLVMIAVRGCGLTRPENSDKYIVFFCVYYNLLMPLIYFGTAFS